MMMTIFIQPHERSEAIDAYRDWLSDDQVTQIEDLEDDSTVVVIHRHDDETTLTLRP